MQSRALRRSIPLAVAATAGCNSSGSSDGGANGAPIRTGDMYISATVEAADDVTAAVNVKLHNGDPLLGTYYTLTGGDQLNACVGTVCKPLTRDSFSTEYDSDFPYVAETAYTISFSRRVDVSAPATVVTLPAAFAILSPSAGMRVTDGETVTVQWSPSGAAERVSVNGRARCDYEDGIRNTRAAVLLGPSSPGTATFSVDSILAARPGAPSTQARLLRCDLMIEVEQRRTGTADAGFAGHGAVVLGADGVIGSVTRSVTLDYAPR